MPASSQTGLLLTKAKPISDSGSTFLITYLRGGKKLLWNSSQERQLRICETNCTADMEVSEEGEGGGVQDVGAEICLQPLVKAVMRQIITLQPMEVNFRQDTIFQPREDPTSEQVDAQGKLL